LILTLAKRSLALRTRLPRGLVIPTGTIDDGELSLTGYGRWSTLSIVTIAMVIVPYFSRRIDSASSILRMRWPSISRIMSPGQRLNTQRKTTCQLKTYIVKV